MIPFTIQRVCNIKFSSKHPYAKGNNWGRKHKNWKNDLILASTFFILCIVCMWLLFSIKAPFLLSLLHNLTYHFWIFSLFLRAFSVFFNDYFFRWLVSSCKSLLSRFSVIINHITQSYNLFSVSSCFSGFSELRFFSIQVFQGSSPGPGSMFKK